MLPPAAPHIKRSQQPYFAAAADGSGHVILNPEAANAGISSQLRGKSAKGSRPAMPMGFNGEVGPGSVVVPVPDGFAPLDGIAPPLGAAELKAIAEKTVANIADADS